MEGFRKERDKIQTMEIWDVRGKRPEKTFGWAGASRGTGSTARRWAAAKKIGAQVLRRKSNVIFIWCLI